VRGDWAAIVTFAERAQKAGTDRVQLARLSKETGAVTPAYPEIAKLAKDSCKVDVPSLN
jgi:copper homeostasis protein CutC